MQLQHDQTAMSDHVPPPLPSHSLRRPGVYSDQLNALDLALRAGQTPSVSTPL